MDAEVQNTKGPDLAPPRKKKRPLLLAALSLFIFVFCLIPACFLSWQIHSHWPWAKLPRIDALGTWPGIEILPEEAVTLDLSEQGLRLSEVENARENPAWSAPDWLYQDGVVVHYATNQEYAVSIWALKYQDSDAACTDWSALTEWTVKSDGLCLWLGQVMSCRWNDAYEEIMCNDHWIIDIVTAEGTGTSGDQLALEVREALAEHWQIIAQTKLSAEYKG